MGTEPETRERRRGERVLIRIPIKIHAIGKDGKDVNQEAEAIVVSRYGALLRTRVALKPGSTVEVLNNFTEEVEKFRLVWISEQQQEGQYEVGVEILKPREDFWGIRFPPRERKA